MARACARGEVRAVGIGRARDGGEPLAKDKEVLGQSAEDGDVFRSVIVDDLVKFGGISRLVSVGMLVDKSGAHTHD